MDANDRHIPIHKAQGVRLLLTAVVLGVASFSILLPLSPAWALARGASEAAAGSVTTVLMATTIMAQFAMNYAIRTFGWTNVLALGLIALGAPATLQVLSSGSAAILVSSALRGIGFGILTVGGATAMALLVPAERRGAAVGVYGLAVALPQLLLMSSAPVLDQRFGSFAMTLIATLPLAGLFLVRPLGRTLNRHAVSDRGPADAGPTERTSTFRLIAPTLLILLIATSSGGAVLTFASQMAPDASSAAIMLLCMTGFATPTRWIFGVLSDRRDMLKMIAGLCAALVLGMAALSAALSIGDPRTARWTLYAGGTLGAGLRRPAKHIPRPGFQAGGRGAADPSIGVVECLFRPGNGRGRAGGRRTCHRRGAALRLRLPHGPGAARGRDRAQETSAFRAHRACPRPMMLDRRRQEWIHDLLRTRVSGVGRLFRLARQ